MPSAQCIVGGRFFPVFLKCIFAKLSGSTAIMLSELPAKVFHIVVAALFCNFTNGIFGICQEILGTAETSVNHIIHTGSTELPPIERLDMAGTQMKLGGHFVHIPGQLRIVIYLLVQGYQLMIVKSGGFIQGTFPELGKQDTQ